MSDTCTTRYGEMVAFGTGDLISRSLELYGEWAFFETRFLSAVLERVPGATVLDAGAFIGTFTLGIASSHPKAVVAVEPNPQARERLRANLSGMKGTDLSIEACCIGSQTGRLGTGRFRQKGNFGSLSFADRVNDGEESGIDVNMRSLSELREQYGPFDLIKLDVEGSETEVLLSDGAWLEANHPIVWVECNENSGAKSIFLALQSMGYGIYYFSYPAYNPQNFKSSTENIFEGGFEAGLLGVAPGEIIECPPDLAAVGAELTELENLEGLRRAMWLTPRWAEDAWTAASRTQLIAHCGRISRNQSFATFLEDLEFLPSSSDVAPSPHESGGNCALYFQLEGQSGFSEAQKLGQAWEFGKGRSVVHFRLQSEQGVQALRFDIADCTGFFEIFAVSVEDVDGSTLWKWDPTEDLFDGLSDDMKMVYPVDAAPCWVFSIGADPYANLLVPPAVIAQLGRSATLVIDFSANLLASSTVTLAEQLSWLTRRDVGGAAGELAVIRQELVDLVQDVAGALESRTGELLRTRAELRLKADEARLLAEKLISAEAKLEVFTKMLPRELDS